MAGSRSRFSSPFSMRKSFTGTGLGTSFLRGAVLVARSLPYLDIEPIRNRGRTERHSKQGLGQLPAVIIAPFATPAALPFPNRRSPPPRHHVQLSGCSHLSQKSATSAWSLFPMARHANAGTRLYRYL